MRYLVILLALLVTGCRTVKEIPVNTVEKIVYRDSLVFVHDTITVKLPYEKVVKVTPDIDTSVLITSYAKSIAFVDTTNNTINHSLVQCGEIKEPIDTVLITQVIEQKVEKEIPIFYEKIVPKRDNQFWIYCLYFYGSILIGIILIIKKGLLK